jgi:SAM-dependent methyltransferase
MERGESRVYENQVVVREYLRERFRSGWNLRGKRVGRFAQIKKGDKVLDLGCGPGLVARIIMDKVGLKGYLVGVDQSRIQLKLAKIFVPEKNARFLVGDFNNFPSLIRKYRLDNINFDHVIFLASWPHVVNTLKFMKHVRFLLNKGGRFTFSMSGDNLNHPYTRRFITSFLKNLTQVVATKYPSLKPKFSTKGYVNPQILRRTIEIAQHSGFKILNTYEVFRKLSLRRKLELYENPARTYWVGDLDQEERFQLIKEAFKKTKEKVDRGYLQRHTYYIVCQKER